MDFDTKVCFSKNIQKQNFNLTISLPIDSNVGIKTILDISAFVYDKKVDCANGKAIVSGKLGVKVLYVDQDNITNTLTSNQPFSETVLDEAITADCFLNLLDFGVVNNVLSQDGALKINCDISFSPVLYLNIGLNQNQTFENMIVKKSEINTNTIACVVDTNFNYSANFETKDNLTKVLCYNSHFTPSAVSCDNGFALIEGKLFAHLVYETSKDDAPIIKEMTDTFNVKTEVKIDTLDKDCVLDACFSLDKSKFNLTTEIEDNSSVVSVDHTICLDGVALKNISLDIVDDVYSVDNEIETHTITRDYFACVRQEHATETVSGELSILDSEPAIDEIVCNLDSQAEITNSYIKDGSLFVEGVVSAQTVYLDENKAYLNKQTELPFVVNTRIQADDLDEFHTSVSVCDCKAKSKRGTIIELEYSLCFAVCLYKKQTKEMIDNLTLGRQLTFEDVDYQIFLAKPNETTWQLCKRIKISMDDLHLFNKDLPPILEGGEKIIIKR